MPIVIAPLDTELTIVKVNSDEKTKKHLQSLGVVTNGKIRVISQSKGNVIVEVKSARLALNKDVATKIFVR